MKKFLFLNFVFILLMKYTSAIEISEIMYDPQGSDTGREWIEIYNNGSTSVNVLNLKFFENNVNHGLTLATGSIILNPGEYAVIVDNFNKFKIDYPNFIGNAFDSSFSLSNSGENIQIRTNTGIILDSVTYDVSMGGNNDNTTLSKINGVFVKGLPTPGAANVLFSDNNSVAANIATSTGSTSVSATSQTQNQSVNYSPIINKRKTININYRGPSIVPAGADIIYTSTSYDENSKILENVDYYYAFGDGGGREGKEVKYSYNIPGEYLLIVEASNAYTTGYVFEKILVIEPKLEIVKIEKNEKNPYIEIKNNSGYDISLSNWYLEIDKVKYKLARGTTILKDKSVKISGKSLGFVSGDVYRILYPNEQVFLENFTGNNLVSGTDIIFKESQTSINDTAYSNNLWVHLYNLSYQVPTSTPDDNLIDLQINKNIVTNLIPHHATQTSILIAQATKASITHKNIHKKVEKKEVAKEIMKDKETINTIIAATNTENILKKENMGFVDRVKKYISNLLY